jgi:hypothetical protein
MAVAAGIEIGVAIGPGSTSTSGQTKAGGSALGGQAILDSSSGAAVKAESFRAGLQSLLAALNSRESREPSEPVATSRQAASAQTAAEEIAGDQSQSAANLSASTLLKSDGSEANLTASANLGKAASLAATAQNGQSVAAVKLSVPDISARTAAAANPTEKDANRIASADKIASKSGEKKTASKAANGSSSNSLSTASNPIVASVTVALPAEVVSAPQTSLVVPLVPVSTSPTMRDAASGQDDLAGSRVAASANSTAQVAQSDSSSFSSLATPADRKIFAEGTRTENTAAKQTGNEAETRSVQPTTIAGPSALAAPDAVGETALQPPAPAANTVSVTKSNDSFSRTQPMSTALDVQAAASTLTGIDSGRADATGSQLQSGSMSQNTTGTSGLNSTTAMVPEMVPDPSQIASVIPARTMTLNPAADPSAAIVQSAVQSTTASQSLAEPAVAVQRSIQPHVPARNHAPVLVSNGTPREAESSGEVQTPAKVTQSAARFAQQQLQVQTVPSGAGPTTPGDPATTGSSPINTDNSQLSTAPVQNTAAAVAIAQAGAVNSEKTTASSKLWSVRGAEQFNTAKSTKSSGEGQSAAPVVDAVAATRELAAAGPAHSGSGFTSAAAGPDTREAFATLDTAEGLGKPAWTHAGAQRAEAGFQDPTLGWVGVRADSTGGGVHAALVPGSADAAEALGSHMAGLNAFLAEHHTQVDTLTLTTPAGGWAGGTTGEQGTGGQTGGQQAREGTDSTESPPSLARNETAESGLPGSSSGSGTAVIPAGAHISVMA